MLGLKINFHKSFSVGVTISQRWLEEATKILNRKIGSTLFKYLDLPIGASLTIIDTWHPVIEAVRSRLSKWKNKQLCIGGLVVLIKSKQLGLLSFPFQSDKYNLKTNLNHFSNNFYGEGVRKINWIK